MTECKTDHANPDNIPGFLCRTCHPELTRTPEQRMAAMAKERIERDAKLAQERAERELRHAEQDLAALEQRDLAPDSTPAKIRDSLRAKVSRLKLAV